MPTLLLFYVPQARPDEAILMNLSHTVCKTSITSVLFTGLPALAACHALSLITPLSSYVRGAASILCELELLYSLLCPASGSCPSLLWHSVQLPLTSHTQLLPWPLAPFPWCSQQFLWPSSPGMISCFNIVPFICKSAPPRAKRVAPLSCIFNASPHSIVMMCALCISALLVDVVRRSSA